MYHVAPVQGYEQSHDASNNLKNLALLVGRAAGGKDPAAYYRSLLQASMIKINLIDFEYRLPLMLVLFVPYVRKYES